MSVNSCTKGKRAERQVAEWLREMGFGSARRGKQFKGTEDSPDVLCKELPWINFEVKARTKLPSTNEMEEWLAKAESECGPKQRALLIVLANRRPPVMAFRRDYATVIPALLGGGSISKNPSGTVRLLDPDPACVNQVFIELYLQVFPGPSLEVLKREPDFLTQLNSYHP